jgi:hypothetical protein
MPLFQMIADERFGAECYFFCRRRDGSNYVVTPAEFVRHIQRILVPTKRRTPEIVANVIEWNRDMCNWLGITCNDIFATDNCSGSGDPMACSAIDVAETQTFDGFFGSLLIEACSIR